MRLVNIIIHLILWVNDVRSGLLVNEKTQVVDSTDGFPNRVLMPWNTEIRKSRVNTPGLAWPKVFISGLNKAIGWLENFRFMADLSYMKIIPSNRKGNSSVETTVELTHLCSFEGYIHGFVRNQVLKKEGLKRHSYTIIHATH